MAAVSLTKVRSELDIDTTRNQVLVASYSLTPSTSYPAGGEPCDLSAATLGWTAVYSVAFSPMTATGVPDGAQWGYDVANKKAFARWTAAAAKGALAEVDALTDLSADVQSVLVIGIR